MNSKRITFRNTSKLCSRETFDAMRDGKIIAKIAIESTTKRAYWYRFDRGLNDPPYNTLSVDGSAVTIDGCKAEIKQFYADQKPVSKKLVLFNGTWHDGRQFFVASHSRADACRLMCDALGFQIRGIDHTIAKYFHKGAWGNKMQGVTPERGVLASENMHSEPKRIV